MSEVEKHVVKRRHSLKPISPVILWGHSNKHVPQRPNNPELLPVDDEGRWFDHEFGPHSVEKKEPIVSPADGPKGKQIVCLKAESDHYQQQCENSMIRTASALRMNLSIHVSGWDIQSQEEAYAQTLRERPDLVISIPGSLSLSQKWYKRLHAANIPVIASTLMPNNGALRYALSWCGHDAWWETRLLARRFAELMRYRGEYCIVEHMPDTSAFYARTYGFLTELKKIAPKMTCLAMETSFLSKHDTQLLVSRWFSQFDKGISGIVSANDNQVLDGIRSALDDFKRSDIVVASNGTTRKGLELIKQGVVHALTFKSPELDGALPVQLASDWFNGLTLEPIQFLPVHVITRENVDEVLNRKVEFQDVDLKPLGTAVENHNVAEIDSFFDSIVLRFVYLKYVSIDLFRGFTIELLSYLMAVIERNDLQADSILGPYESVFKNLFHQPTVEHTIRWLNRTSHLIVRRLEQLEELSKIDRVVQYVNNNFSMPMSLKELSNRFGLSPQYLGQRFVKKTGCRFNEYLQKVRVAEAMKYLVNSSLSAAKIAHEIGYNDPDYFYKVFRQHLGMGPTEYRKQRSR